MSSLSTERQPATARAAIPSLYALKALLVFFVVTRHAPILIPWLDIPGLTTELFFAITGYFLYSEDLEKVQSRIWKSIKKVIPIMIFLQIFYLPLAPPNWDSLVLMFNWAFMGIANFGSGHLWYLTSLLFSLITFSIFLKCFKGRLIPMLFLGVLGWILLEHYRYFIDGKEQSVYVFNFISRALPFLAMGYWVRANETTLLKHSWLNIYLLLFVLSSLEYLLVLTLSGGHTHGGLIEVFPLRLAFFMLLLSYKDFGKGTCLETIGEKYSGNIYYFHMAVIIGWKALNAHSPLLSEIYEYGGAFIVFFISLGIAWLVVKLQDLIGYHVLK